MTDILAIGEILIDLTQTGVNEAGVPLFAANPGGAPANVAVAASRLGAKTAFLGRVGNDGFGAYLRQVLEENGVDSRGLRTGDIHTTMAIVAVDGTGERSFRFVRGADRDLSLRIRHFHLWNLLPSQGCLRHFLRSYFIQFFIGADKISSAGSGFQIPFGDKLVVSHVHRCP